MTKKEWKEKYIERITLACGDKKFATECYLAGKIDHDYEDDPVDAAEMEMSYWDSQAY